MVESDLEGPWVRADHAFDAVSRRIPRGEDLFRVISSYDDVRFFAEKVPGYEPGDTLMLVAPFLMAYGADEVFLRAIASEPENTRLVPHAREAIRQIKAIDNLYLISTSYSQYVEKAAGILGVRQENTFCTHFPIEELRAEVSEADLELVQEWTERIAGMPRIEMDESGRILPEWAEAKKALDHLFWEILPRTSFSRTMEVVKPLGGTRKYGALLEALRVQGKLLRSAAVVGDSITDSVMLEKARDAGALALSFNGNRYSIGSSNAALISGTCWATTAVIEIYLKRGLAGVKEASGTWDERSMEHLESLGCRGKTLGGLEAAIGEGPAPWLAWVDASEMGELVRASEDFRKGLRGESIGALG